MPPKASSSTPNAPAKLSAQEVPAMFQRYRTELQNLAQKIGELESELEEHTLVQPGITARAEHSALDQHQLMRW